MQDLGYPLYVMTLLGIFKLLGVVTLLLPGLKRPTEWAYAGFTFDLIGAARKRGRYANRHPANRAPDRHVGRVFPPPRQPASVTPSAIQPIDDLLHQSLGLIRLEYVLRVSITW